MKIFISWSGPVSHAIAQELADWLILMESSLEVFISSKAISKGSVWFSDVSQHLRNSTLGIIILTPDNLGSPWLNFEAGALFQGLEEPRVIPFLVGIENLHLNNFPLEMFQTITTNRDQIYDLIKQINSLLVIKRSDDQITRLFDKLWPEFDIFLQKVTNQIKDKLLYSQDLISFGRTQQELEAQSKGLFCVINDTNSLRISGGTFKTFCDSSRNLEAVKKIIDRKGSVKLLMLNPQGDGISMLAKMRKDYSPRITEEKLKFEIEMSIDRMLDVFGEFNALKIIRLYQALPRYALCIGDKYALLTLYLHGHGASSPSFLLRVDDIKTKEFCGSLIKGFDESWASSLSNEINFG